MKEAKNSLFRTLVVKCVKNLKGRAFQRGFEGFTLLVNKTPRSVVATCVTRVGDWDGGSRTTS